MPDIQVHLPEVLRGVVDAFTKFTDHWSDPYNVVATLILLFFGLALIYRLFSWTHRLISRIVYPLVGATVLLNSTLRQSLVWTLDKVIPTSQVNILGVDVTFDSQMYLAIAVSIYAATWVVWMLSSSDNKNLEVKYNAEHTELGKLKTEVAGLQILIETNRQRLSQLESQLISLR